MSIETAAMEKILADLYKATQAQGKAQAAAFEKLAKAAGLDPKIVKQTDNNVKDLGKSSDDAAESTGKLARAGNLVGAALADLVGGVAATTGNLVKFGFSTLSGTAKMSDLIGAFKDLPIIGTVAGLFAALQKMQEQNLNMYRSLSASGINFGTGLQALQGDFLKLGLTSEEYVKTLTSNTDVFTLMGGSVTKGAKNFVALNKSLLDNHSNLLSLGFSYQELSNVVTSFARVTGGLSKQQQQDTKGTADSMAAYAKEIDLLARLNGESRESLQKKLEAEQQEANWQAFLSTLPKEMREAHASMLAQAQALQGVAGAEIYKASALGITATSDQAGLVYSLMGDSAQHISETARQVQSGQLDVKTIQSKYAQLLAEGQFKTVNDFRKNGEGFMSIMQQAGGAFGTAFTTAATLTTKFNENRIYTHEAAMSMFAEEQAQQDIALTKKNAEIDAQTQAERVIRELAYTVSKALIPVVNSLLVPALKWLYDEVDTVTAYLKDVFLPGLAYWGEKLFTETGRTEMINKITEKFEEIIDIIGTKILNSDTYRKLDGAANTAGNTAIGAGIGGSLALAIIGAAAALSAPLTGGASLALLAAGIGGGGFLGYQSRESTTLGATGKPFENFGSGTPVMGHNIEGMFKPEQISSLITNSRAESFSMAIELLNNNNNQMMSVLREINENTRRNVEATRTMNNAFG